MLVGIVQHHCDEHTSSLPRCESTRCFSPTISKPCRFFTPTCACRKSRCGHIGGVARRDLGDKESARLVRRRARPAHLSPKTNASVPRCDNSCTTAVCDGRVAHRAQQRGQGIPVGSNRSTFPHMRFAMASAATRAKRKTFAQSETYAV